MRVRLPLALAALLLAACGSPGDAGSQATSTTVSPPTSSPQQTTTTGAVNAPSETTMPDETEMIETATRDLAQRLLTPEENIEVVEVRSVTWPDGSIGCPEEGMVYTQALVEGTQVLLGSDGKIYDYHAGDDGEIFFCPSEEDKDGGYDFVPPPGFDE